MDRPICTELNPSPRRTQRVLPRRRLRPPPAPSRMSCSFSAPGLDVSRLVEKAGQLPEIRQDRVNQIRAQIAAGTYETDEKLGIALGRLMNELG